MEPQGSFFLRFQWPLKGCYKSCLRALGLCTDVLKASTRISGLGLGFWRVHGLGLGLWCSSAAVECLKHGYCHLTWEQLRATKHGPETLDHKPKHCGGTMFGVLRFRVEGSG